MPTNRFSRFLINQSIDNWSIIDNRLIESENRWRQSIRHGRKPMIHQLLGHYRLQVWPRVNFCFYGCIPGCGRIRPNRFFWNRRNTTCSNTDFLQIFLQSVLRPILNYKKIKKVGCLTDHEINFWPWVHFHTKCDHSLWDKLLIMSYKEEDLFSFWMRVINRCVIIYILF